MTLKKFTKTIALMISLLFAMCANAALFMEDDNLQQDMDLKNDLYDSAFPGSDFLDLTQPQQDLRSDVKQNYQSVLDLINEGKTQQAKEKVAELIRQEPGQSVYYNLKALLEIKDKDRKAAKQTYQKAIEIDKNNFLAHTALAKLALDEKDYINAQKYAADALDINRYSVPTYEVLADIAMQQRGIDAVEEFLLQSQKDVSDNLTTELSILRMLGRVYGYKKQPEKQLPLVEDLVKRHPRDIATLSYFAGVLLVNNELARAEEALRQIILQQPNDGKHLLWLARILRMQPGKEDETLTLLDRAAQNLEDPLNALILKTTFLITKKRYAEALAVANKIDESYPKMHTGKTLLGDTLFAQKKYDEALDYYRQSYQMMPTRRAMDQILIILTAQNKPQEAIVFLQNEHKKHPDNALIQYKLADAFFQTGDYSQSIMHYEKLIAQKTDNIFALNNLAWAYYASNDIKKAVQTSEKGYQIKPDLWLIADTYGYFLLKNGDSKKSLTILTKASALNPQNEEVRLHLAESYIANGNREEAKKILEPLIEKQGKLQAQAKKLIAH